MTEVQNNDFDSVNYTYMDPANGLNRGVFTGDDLTMDLTQGRNESVLLHYNPSITEWNTNNSTIALQTLEEAMEIDYAGVRCSIATQASRRKRRSNENKIQCSNEKKFYFNEVKNNIKLESVYNGSNNHRTEVKKLFTFNLGKINPLTFSKLSFLFDEGEDDNSSTYASLGNESFYGEKINDFFKDKYIKDIIRNKKINNENEIKSSDLNFLQSINPYHLIVSQKIGLTFYWENDNYYLQFLTYQFAENYIVFPQGGIIWMKIGKGIKLYN